MWNIPSVNACDTKTSTTLKANTTGLEIKRDSEKKDCGKPDCKTAGCYDGRHEQKKWGGVHQKKIHQHLFNLENPKQVMNVFVKFKYFTYLFSFFSRKNKQDLKFLCNFEQNLTEAAELNNSSSVL